ncbi:MAG: right-handed parallel beta-helix repeat-containing protein [Thermoleophilia bacterium]
MGVTATGNTANGGNGIYLQSSSNDSVTGSISSSNSYGIWLQGCSNTTISGSTFNNSSGNGIVNVNNTGGNLITGNTISGTSGYSSMAVDLGATNNDQLVANTVSNNAATGIVLFGSSTNTLNGNLITAIMTTAFL